LTGLLAAQGCSIHGEARPHEASWIWLWDIGGNQTARRAPSPNGFLKAPEISRKSKMFHLVAIFASRLPGACPGADVFYAGAANRRLWATGGRAAEKTSFYFPGLGATRPREIFWRLDRSVE